MRLKDFHKELNKGNKLEAYKIATELQRKYIKLRAPNKILNYIDDFIREFKNQKLINENKIKLSEENTIKNEPTINWIDLKNKLKNKDKTAYIEEICFFLKDKYSSDCVSEKCLNNYYGFINSLITNNNLFIFIDAWFDFDNSISTRFKLQDKEDITLNLFQPSIVRENQLDFLNSYELKGGEYLIKTDLKNPYLPIIFTVFESKNKIFDIFFLPFPSLIRNGLHYSELLFKKPNHENKIAITEYSYDLYRNLIDQKVDGKLIKRKIIINKSHSIDDYKLIYLFKSLNFEIDNLTNKNQDNFYITIENNCIPSLDSLTSNKYSQNNTLYDYSLFINKLDYSPEFIIRNPINNTSNIRDLKFKLIGLTRDIRYEINNSYKNFYNLDNLKEYKINSNNKFTIIIFNIDCEHKLRLVLENILKQENITINKIFIITNTEYEKSIAEFVYNENLLKDILMILDLNQFSNFLFNQKSQNDYLIFINPKIKIEDNNTFNYLSKYLQVKNNISNVGCTLIHDTNNHDNMEEFRYIIGMQLNIANIINNNDFEINEIDVNNIQHIKEFYPLINSTYFSIWEDRIINKFKKNIRSIINIDQFLIELSLLSIFNKYKSLCITDKIILLQEKQAANKRFFLSRETSEAILHKNQLLNQFSSKLMNCNL